MTTQKTSSGLHPPGSMEVLIGRIASQDDHAMAAFYDLTRSRVYGLAWKLAGERGLAEEATLEVYTQVWRDAGGYDRRRGSPWSWLLILARTRTLDLLRARRRRQGAEKAWDDVLTEHLTNGDEPSATSERSEVASCVRRALLGLPKPQRDALAHAYFGGLSYAETAQLLGVPEGTIKTRIRAGLATLRLSLKGLEESNP